MNSATQMPSFFAEFTLSEKLQILRFAQDDKRRAQNDNLEISKHPVGIYSRNVIRASSFFSRSRSAASFDTVNRLASVKNRFFSCSFASMPLSIRSTMTRLALLRCALAKDLTRWATRLGRVTLWRNDLPVAPIGSLYTNTHHNAP